MSPTEQTQLMANRNGVQTNDVVAYFVRSTNPAFNGCAAHPANRPSAVVASIASEWTLGHEVGHVLGLAHVTPTDRLMMGGGTNNITNPPPDLIASEVQTMNNSPFTQNLGYADRSHKETTMPISLAKLKSLLDVDEPDYPALAEMAAGAMQHVRKLAASPDVSLASKAVSLAGIMGDADSVGCRRFRVEVAPRGRSRRGRSCREPVAGQSTGRRVVSKLLDDKDIGVVKFATRAASRQSDPAVSKKAGRAVGRMATVLAKAEQKSQRERSAAMALKAGKKAGGRRKTSQGNSQEQRQGRRRSNAHGRDDRAAERRESPRHADGRDQVSRRGPAACRASCAPVLGCLVTCITAAVSPDTAPIDRWPSQSRHDFAVPSACF